MTTPEIIVTAKWTAKPGKADELKAMWESVAEKVKANEPGVSRLECFDVPESEALIVHEVFQDGAALGAHFGGEALGEFLPKLSAIADPGPYFFYGDVPDELVQAASGMNIGAVFGTHTFGFSRSPPRAA